jgi:hypothetical protein
MFAFEGLETPRKSAVNSYTLNVIFFLCIFSQWNFSVLRCIAYLQANDTDVTMFFACVTHNRSNWTVLLRRSNVIVHTPKGLGVF